MEAPWDPPRGFFISFFMRVKSHLAIAYGLLLIILVLVYWAGLGGAFFFDDGPSILLAPGVKLESLSGADLRQAWSSGGAGPTGRPIAQLSFALNYYFNGFSPFAYKLSNLVIHGICGVLVLALIHRVLSATYPGEGGSTRRWIAVAMAGLWLLHPIQLLAILHVVQRMTILSTLFLVTALHLHISGRERSNSMALLLLAWCVFWPLSILSKEMGALFPVFVLAWELTIRRSTAGQFDRFARGYIVLSGLALVATCIYLVSSKSEWLWAGYALRPFSMMERVMSEGRVLWIYLGLIFLPRLSSFGLYHDDIAISKGWLDPWLTAPAAIGLALLIALAWRLRAKRPLLAFGMAWFFIGHALESTLLPLEIAHEHRNYLPLVGIAIAGACVLGELEKRYPKRLHLKGASVLALLLGVSVVTAMRAHQFGDEIRRTLLAVQDHPASAQAQYEAGNTLASLPALTTAESPLYARARQYFMQSMALNPAFKMGGLGLIYIHCKTGLSPAARDVEELVQRLHDTPFAPGDRSVLYLVKEMSIDGTLCLTRLEVERLFAAAMENSTVSAPVRAILLSWYADFLWLHEHDMAAARGALGKSLALNPTNASNRLKWAQLLFLSREWGQAGKLLVALKEENLTSEERETRQELLTAIHNNPD